MEVPFLTITLPLHIANIISLRRSSFFETFSSKKISRDVSLCSSHHFSGARFDCGHASSDRLQVRRRAEGKRKKKEKKKRGNPSVRTRIYGFFFEELVQFLFLVLLLALWLFIIRILYLCSFSLTISRDTSSK